MFSNPDFARTEGESYAGLPKKGSESIKRNLNGFSRTKNCNWYTGLVMTLMMNYFDKQYSFEFLMNTSKPDIYKMELKEEQLMNVERLWKAE